MIKIARGFNLLKFSSLVLALGASLLQAASAADEWTPLFNGKNLDGWTPKIRGYPFGDNHAGTFVVTNGAITVNYAGYENFDNKFGHLFYKQPYSKYVLRIEYRFTGKQVPGGPGWAFRNSGVMIHCQDPASMRREQDFPVSIEVQLLGGNGTQERTTLNLCTPGTHVVLDGKLHTPHCTDSRSKTYHGDQWVSAEIEVHGSGKIIHRIDGQTVLEYEKPQLDPGDADAKALMKDGKVLLDGGYISLQSESHPVEFRRVEIRELKE